MNNSVKILFFLLVSFNYFEAVRRYIFLGNNKSIVIHRSQP